MTQFSLFQPPVWTISEITAYIREQLESDPNLGDLWVQGEVSNASRPASGHFYFTLKDATSALRCVMWRPNVLRQAYIPRDGDAIEAHGAISIYETAGQYQLYVDQIRPAGEGKLYQEFMLLKARLEAEGLFDPVHKRPIPAWPSRIGIVTSPTGAALRDALNTIRRRYPLVEIILAPTPVQGADAPAGIIHALESLNRFVQPDIILLLRGGGSIEDLWAFNDEQVAHAIYDSPIPIITGVGHETDFTIADLVSDLRAPTPTAAAELATPDGMELAAELEEMRLRLQRTPLLFLRKAQWQLDQLSSNLSRVSPLARVRTDRQKIDELLHRSEISASHNISFQRVRLDGLDQRLSSLNPQAILSRGYALVTDHEGQIIRSIQQVQPFDQIQIRVSDGDFDAQVGQLIQSDE